MQEFLATIVTSPEFGAFLITVLVAVASFLGKALRDFIVQKAKPEQLRFLMDVATKAVRVAEQTGLSKTGEEKKAEAMAIAQTFLDAYGVKVSAAQLSAAIEAAVFVEIGKIEVPEPIVEVSDSVG